MRVSLIGMSGSGKSSWSRKLAGHGFKWFCCDDLIAKKLASELALPGGNMMELGEWMGFPYESRYHRRESKYLGCEIEVMTDIVEYLEGGENQDDSGTVIDTTGSVVYAGRKILKRLRQCTTVVHLSTPPEVQDRMLKAYITNKRPVLWRNLFEKKSEETRAQALARCYPKLLNSRERLYERISDVTIDYYRLNQEGFGVRDFLDSIAAGRGGGDR